MDRFNPLDLEMDSEEMLGRLKTWVHCESPSWDAAAVNRMADLVSYELAVLDARIDRIKISGFGDALRARFPHPDEDRAGILVLGHLDTVHPIGSMFWRRDDKACFGPGILDMKAGNFLVLEALRQLQGNSVPTELPVTILFTSDEEVGSAASRQLIEAEALRSRYVLVPEPARPDGSLVEGRHAVARFRLRTDGRSGHAGHAAAAGVSAIREMAEKVVALEDLSNGEAYCRVGVINGGKWLNCVPMVCEAELLVVAQTRPSLDDLVGRITSEAAKLAGAAFHVEPGPLRPFWKPSSEGNPILEEARSIAALLGFEFDAVIAGGGSDGNFTGSLGVPTLDGLGAQGDGLHTTEEYIVVDSLAQRGRLMAGLLARLR
jgi:glutamate carboxypeptidase